MRCSERRRAAAELRLLGIQRGHGVTRGQLLESREHYEKNLCVCILGADGRRAWRECLQLDRRREELGRQHS